jgi:hypothetical protein
VRRINQLKEGKRVGSANTCYYSNLIDETSPFSYFSRIYVLILEIYDIINMHSYMQGGQWLLP